MHLIDKHFGTETTGWKRWVLVALEVYVALWIGFLIPIATAEAWSWSIFPKPESISACAHLLGLPVLFLVVFYFRFFDQLDVLSFPSLEIFILVTGVFLLGFSPQSKARFAGFLFILVAGLFLGWMIVSLTRTSP